jgi:hypothetical protein
MRYDNTEIIRLVNGKKVYETVIPRQITKKDNDIYVITQETDRLDTLARQYYNDPSLWWIIAQANNLNSVNLGLEPGIQLRIPADKIEVLNNI